MPKKNGLARAQGNLINLALETADGDWEAAGVLAFVLVCYLIGTAIGIGYLALAKQAWTQRALGLVLTLVFVALDAILVSGIPNGTQTERGLVACLVAIPLAALNQITKARLGLGAVAMTGNLQGAVDMMWHRVDTWFHHQQAATHAGHLARLKYAAPVLFLVGALAGAGLERAIDYSLTPLAPLFVAGLWASEAPDEAATDAAAKADPRRPRAAPTTTAQRFTLRLDL